MDKLLSVDTSKLNKAELADHCAKLTAGFKNLAEKGKRPERKYTNCRSVTFQANEAVMPSVADADVMQKLRELNAIHQYAQLVEEWKSAKVQITDQWGNPRYVQRVRTYQEVDVLETTAELEKRLETAKASADGTSHKIFRLNESLPQYKPDDKYSGFKAPTCFGTNDQVIPHEEHEELITRNPESKKQRMLQIAQKVA